MKNQQKWAKWAKTRAKGKWSFIITWGVAYWGGSVFVASVFIDRAGLLVFRIFKTWGEYCVWFVMCMAGGAVYGYMMWNLFEKSYLCDKRKNTDDE